MGSKSAGNPENWKYALFGEVIIIVYNGTCSGTGAKSHVYNCLGLLLRLSSFSCRFVCFLKLLQSTECIYACNSGIYCQKCACDAIMFLTLCSMEHVCKCARYAQCFDTWLATGHQDEFCFWNFSDPQKLLWKPTFGDHWLTSSIRRWRCVRMYVIYYGTSCMLIYVLTTCYVCSPSARLMYMYIISMNYLHEPEIWFSVVCTWFLV